MTDPELLALYERRFRDDPDPWHFQSSPYEQAKRAATVAACGPTQIRRSTLELGAANGVLAAELAEFSDRLVAVEGVAAAATLATERLRAYPDASVVRGLIPAAVPAGPYDLVVASEILYYLDAAAYEDTLRALPGWLAADGRLVAVHWRPVGVERPRSADDVHRDLTELPGLEPLADHSTPDYRLSVLGRAA